MVVEVVLACGLDLHVVKLCISIVSLNFRFCFME